MLSVKGRMYPTTRRRLSKKGNSSILWSIEIYRKWAMIMDSRGIKLIIHASTFFAPILVPLLIWLFLKDHERETKNLAMEAMIFHIVISFCIWVSALLSFLLIGIPFLIVFLVIGLFYPIKGIVYALQDRTFHYPIIGSLLNR
ncbi:DUF4870 domain-containing protein [Brevibacillus sp. SYSU BS000544]|uniref:DUF4870 domain-containing protein n=1 Tax=Brevibacillus sp. SYSU BS000544 TaxID=3416443 RepID=UPI003CE51132